MTSCPLNNRSLTICKQTNTKFRIINIYPFQQNSLKLIVMVGWKMDGPARDRVLKLMDEKDRLESQIREHNAVLERNNIDLHEPLVDGEGFPRSDIQVYEVRHARHHIFRLQNDHKNIMKMIEQGLAEVHSELRGSNGDRSTQAPTTSNGHVGNGHMNGNSSGEDNVQKEPFAVVTLVDDGSPADLAGLCNNDKILQFGSVTHSNFSDMAQIYNIVTHSVGQPINVEVKRERTVVSLNLVPRPWAQPGLLGCHIQRI